jgi:hypothetical protein
MCDYPDFSTETYPRARKAHECEECGQEIRIGTTYVRIAGKFDGAMFCFKMHEPCYELFQLVAGESGIEYGCLDTEIKDRGDEALSNEWEHIKRVVAS